MIKSLRNRTESSQELSSDLAQTSGIQVYSLTIRRAHVKEGFHGQVARRKLYLRQGNRQKKLEFAKEYRKWNVEQ